MDNISSVQLSTVETQKATKKEIPNKVAEVAKRVFQKIGEVLLFPVRFFGAKRWSIPGLLFRLPAVIGKHLLNRSDTSLEEDLFGSGYHNMNIPPLPQADTRHAIECASLAAAIHKSKSEWVEPFGIKPVDPRRFLGELVDEDRFLCNEKEGVLFDSQTALKMGFYEKENTLYVVFGAIGSNVSEMPNEEEAIALKKKMEKMSVTSGLGGVPDCFDQADQLIQLIQSRAEGKQIHLTGQSLGAAVASYVALKQHIPATALNCMAFGPGIQKKVGAKNLNQANRFVTQVVTDGDWISHPPLAIRVASIFLDLIGIRTAGIFGKSYIIPHAKAYKTDRLLPSILDIHRYILGNLLVHADPKAEKLAATIGDPKEFSNLFNEWLKQYPTINMR